MVYIWIDTQKRVTPFVVAVFPCPAGVVACGGLTFVISRDDIGLATTTSGVTPVCFLRSCQLLASSRIPSVGTRRLPSVLGCHHVPLVYIILIIQLTRFYPLDWTAKGMPIVGLFVENNLLAYMWRVFKFVLLVLQP